MCNLYTYKLSRDEIRGKSPRFIARTLLAATICVGSAGCISPPSHWEKEGTDQVALQRDLATCRVSARDEVERNTYSSPTPIYRPIWRGPYSFSVAGNYISQGDLTRFCMRNKGYELVPDQPKQ